MMKHWLIVFGIALETYSGLFFKDFSKNVTSKVLPAPTETHSSYSSGKKHQKDKSDFVQTPLNQESRRKIMTTDKKAESQSVSYQRIGVDEYQNFVKNWDNKKQPIFLAVIQTPEQYDAIFHPAAVMGDTRKFAPDPQLFEHEQILLAARVMKASEGDFDQSFTVESITSQDDELIVKYRYNEPQSNATWFVKNFLCLRIPKYNYQKVTFIENGKIVGEFP